MNPEAIQLHTAAVKLVAAIKLLFPNAHQAVWETSIPEPLVAFLKQQRRTWKAFAIGNPDQAHAALVQRIAGLQELRTALRRCRKQARDARERGPAGVEFADLLNTILNSQSIQWVDDDYCNPYLTSDDQIYVSFRIHVTPPNHHLAEKMAEAVKNLPLSGKPRKTEIVTERKPRGRPRGITPEMAAEAEELKRQTGSWETATKAYNEQHGTKLAVSTVSGWGRYLRLHRGSGQQKEAA